MKGIKRAPMTDAFRGKTALVTGGASGLGLAITQRLLADGARVLVADVHAERPHVVPTQAEYFKLDVRSNDDWSAAWEWVEANWGHLDLLFNNAGIGLGGRIDRIGEDEWERGLDINLMGVVRGCTTFVPMMKAQRSGTIVNTASLAGLIYGPGMSTYNATKAAVVALSETLWSELQPFGVGVSVICPGFFRTNLGDSLQGSDARAHAAARKLIDSSPRTADDIAAVVLPAVARGKHLILTEPDGRIAYAAKRFARPLYDIGLRKAGARLAKGKESALPN